MALGNTQTNTNKLYILKLKTKDDKDQPVAPHFAVLEKTGEKQWEVTKTETNVSGDLVRVELENKENPKVEGEFYDIVKLTLDDSEAGESYLLDLRMNNLTRSLFNGLASLEKFSDVKISLWESTKNDKTYPAISARQGGELINWKHDFKTLPKPEETKNKKGVVVSRDFTELNEVFLTDLKDLAERVKDAPKSPKKVKAAPQESSEVVDSEELEDNSIPF